MRPTRTTPNSPKKNISFLRCNSEGETGEGCAQVRLMLADVGCPEIAPRPDRREPKPAVGDVNRKQLKTKFQFADHIVAIQPTRLKIYSGICDSAHRDFTKKRLRDTVFKRDGSWSPSYCAYVPPEQKTLSSSLGRATLSFQTFPR